MSRAYSLLGRWRGGPYNSKVMIFYEDDGTAAATFKCPSGAEGKVAGIFMEGCRRLRGRFYDPDAGGGPGKMERIDLVLEADGKSWHTEGGASWNGRRYSWRSSKDLPPPETNEKWERLQKRVDLDVRALWRCRVRHRGIRGCTDVSPHAHCAGAHRSAAEAVGVDV